MARFKIFVDGEARLYDLLDEECSVGSATDCSLRVDVEGVASRCARIWREGDAVWIGPADGASLVVGGEAVEVRRRLWHGDKVELGPGAALEFVDPTARAPAPVRPAAPVIPAVPVIPAAPRIPAAPVMRAASIAIPSVGRERRARTERRERGPERKRPFDRPPSRPAWHLFSGLILLGIAVVWILIRVAGGAGGARSVEDLLALAEAQQARGNLQLALRTAETAIERADGDARLLAAVLAFEAKARAALQLANDLGELDLARHAEANLKVFERSYLLAEPTNRAACREFVRLADRWESRYAQTCERYDESRPLVAVVAALRAKYAGPAALDEPDVADDVLFAALRATRLKRPRYREALERLDEFLAGQPSAPDAARVRTFREEQERAGRAWLEDQIQVLRRERERGRTDAVLAELRFMIDENLPVSWCAELEALDRQWRAESGR